MGVILRAKDADFSGNYQRYIPPVTEGLEGWFFHRGSAAQSVKNHAPGKLDATVAGAPTFGDDFSTFSQTSNYLQTAIAQPSAATFFSIVSAISINPAVSVSNYNSARPAAAGNSLATTLQLAVAASILRPSLIAACWDGSDTATSALANAGTVSETVAVDTPTLLVGTYTGTSRKCIDKTTGVSSANTATQPYPDLGAPLRLGSGYLAVGTPSPHRQYFSAIYSRVLTDIEIETVAQAVRSIYANWGVTV